MKMDQNFRIFCNYEWKYYYN